jgi:hypothetical protein
VFPFVLESAKGKQIMNSINKKKSFGFAVIGVFFLILAVAIAIGSLIALYKTWKSSENNLAYSNKYLDEKTRTNLERENDKISFKISDLKEDISRKIRRVRSVLPGYKPPPTPIIPRSLRSSDFGISARQSSNLFPKTIYSDDVRISGVNLVFRNEKEILNNSGEFNTYLLPKLKKSFGDGSITVYAKPRNRAAIFYYKFNSNKALAITQKLIEAAFIEDYFDTVTPPPYRVKNDKCQYDIIDAVVNDKPATDDFSKVIKATYQFEDDFKTSLTDSQYYFDSTFPEIINDKDIQLEVTENYSHWKGPNDKFKERFLGATDIFRMKNIVDSNKQLFSHRTVNIVFMDTFAIDKNNAIYAHAGDLPIEVAPIYSGQRFVGLPNTSEFVVAHGDQVLRRMITKEEHPATVNVGAMPSSVTDRLTLGLLNYQSAYTHGVALNSSEDEIIVPSVHAMAWASGFDGKFLVTPENKNNQCKNINCLMDVRPKFHADVINFSRTLDADPLKAKLLDSSGNNKIFACGGESFVDLLNNRLKQAPIIVAAGNHPMKFNGILYACGEHTVGVFGTGSPYNAHIAAEIVDVKEYKNIVNIIDVPIHKSSSLPYKYVHNGNMVGTSFAASLPPGGSTIGKKLVATVEGTSIAAPVITTAYALDLMYSGKKSIFDFMITLNKTKFNLYSYVPYDQRLTYELDDLTFEKLMTNSLPPKPIPVFNGECFVTALVGGGQFLLPDGYKSMAECN